MRKFLMPKNQYNSFVKGFAAVHFYSLCFRDPLMSVDAAIPPGRIYNPPKGNESQYRCKTLYILWRVRRILRGCLIRRIGETIGEGLPYTCKENPYTNSMLFEKYDIEMYEFLLAQEDVNITEDELLYFDDIISYCFNKDNIKRRYFFFTTLVDYMIFSVKNRTLIYIDDYIAITECLHRFSELSVRYNNFEVESRMVLLNFQFTKIVRAFGIDIVAFRKLIEIKISDIRI